MVNRDKQFIKRLETRVLNVPNVPIVPNVPDEGKNMRFRHEKLEVWQLAMQLITLIYKIVDKFPKSEMYALSSQLKRAVISIALNISEGSGRWSNKEFSQFIRNALASLLETDTALKIAIKLGYIKTYDYQKTDFIIEKLYFKLIALDKALKNNKRSDRTVRTSEAIERLEQSKSRGFTLIEILIAAVIFAAVVSIALGVFTTSSSIQTTTEIMRNTSEGGRYALEAMAREVRLATQGFEICGDVVCDQTFNITAGEDQLSGNFLIVNTAAGVKKYGLEESTLKVWTADSDFGQSLIADDLEVNQVNDGEPIFKGYYTGADPSKQPFVTIQFTVKNKNPVRVTEEVSQTLRTTVTTRAYGLLE